MFGVIRHEHGEFPRECALELLDMVKNKQLQDNPLKAASCVFAILSWAAGWFGGDDEPVIGATQPSPDDMVLLGQLCESTGDPIPSGGIVNSFIMAQIKAMLAKVLMEIIADPSAFVDEIKKLIDELL